jgi:hypothetical protein
VDGRNIRGYLVFDFIIDVGTAASAEYRRQPTASRPAGTDMPYLNLSPPPSHAMLSSDMLKTDFL